MQNFDKATITVAANVYAVVVLLGVLNAMGGKRQTKKKEVEFF